MSESENALHYMDNVCRCIHVKLNDRDIFTQQDDISSGQHFAPMRPLIGQLLANQQETGRRELGGNAGW